MNYKLVEPVGLSKQEQLIILEKALNRLKCRLQEYCCLAIVESFSKCVSIHSDVKFIIPSFTIEKATEICRSKKIRKPKIFLDESWWVGDDYNVRIRFMSAFIQDFKNNLNV